MSEILTSDTAKSIYFNILVDDTDHDVTSTPANIILNGTLDLIITAYDATL